MRNLAIALTLAAAPAVAQDGLVFDPAPLAACVEGNGGLDCLWIAANACIAATPGGNSTAGMIGCAAAERDWWDADLNASYQRLRQGERFTDETWTNPPGMIPRPSGAEALRDVQRAWIVWRDATCRYEELQWWGGTGAALVHVSCNLQLTAEQALTLRRWLAAGG